MLAKQKKIVASIELTDDVKSPSNILLITLIRIIKIPV